MKVAIILHLSMHKKRKRNWLINGVAWVYLIKHFAIIDPKKYLVDKLCVVQNFQSAFLRVKYCEGFDRANRIGCFFLNRPSIMTSRKVINYLACLIGLRMFTSKIH